MKIIQIAFSGHSLYGLSNEGVLYQWQNHQEAIESRDTGGVHHPAFPMKPSGWVLCKEEIKHE